MPGRPRRSVLSRFSGSSRLPGFEPFGGGSQQVLAGTGGGEQEADPAGVSQNNGADPEQFVSDCPSLGTGHIGVFKTDASDRFDGRRSPASNWSPQNT